MNQQAEDQLRAIDRGSGGAIELLSAYEEDGKNRYLVSLDTDGIVSRSSGINVRRREKFILTVPDTYPFTPPVVNTPHRRWAGTAHVQWGNQLCIYAAPSVEWHPADGMRGFIARLMLWLEHAAEGTLDPDGQPLHPPAVYFTRTAGTLVVNPDLGDRVPWSGGENNPNLLLAWCVRDGDRIDIVEWQDLSDAFDRVIADGFQTADAAGRPYFLAPCILIDAQIGFEYPNTAAELTAGLASHGIPEQLFLKWLALTSRVNAHIRRLAAADLDDPRYANLILVGTPSRRIDDEFLAHISGWKLDDTGDTFALILGATVLGALTENSDEIMTLAAKWVNAASTTWTRVLENRPEVTRRRDERSPARFLAGKRVLLLGCGAIGAPIAEACVRAGVRALKVVDTGVVTPGILVRQAYEDADIGSPKAHALATRLTRIRRDLTVDGVVGNGVVMVSDYANISVYDLVIDATADVGVRSAIEKARTIDGDDWPDLVTVLIGHEAKRGVVAVSPKRSAAGGADILRRTAVRVRTEEPHGWADVIDDLFPAVPRQNLFFPEPGCSSPTFLGGFHEVTALATMMLDAAIDALRSAPARSTAVAVRLPSTAPSQASVLTWEPDWVVTDQTGKYTIRVSAAAVGEMRAEARRGLRVRGKMVETGGMLLGQIDEATRVVSVDAASGPPPDSLLSSVYFDHGTLGTQETVDYYRERSVGATGFVGIWHTHPYGRAWPSGTDKNGMAEILSVADSGPRAIMFILGGQDSEWADFVQTGEQPRLYAEVVERPVSRPFNAPVGGLPVGVTFYPGGYGYVPAHPMGGPARKGNGGDR